MDEWDIHFDPTTRRFRLNFDMVSGMMPALNGMALRNWRAEHGDVANRWARDIGAVTGWRDDLTARMTALNGLVDVLVAYDIDGALGGREGIRETLDASQIAIIVRAILDAHG